MKNLILLVTSSLAILLTTPLYAEQKNSDIVKSIDIRLTEKTRFNQQEPIKKVFKDYDYEGWFNSEGDWNIQGKVAHGRLRCATYQLGVRLGKGSPACLNVEWITDIHYGTRKEQCNSAVMTHKGGGEIDALKLSLQDATCVKVVTRCTGVCEKTEKK